MHSEPFNLQVLIQMLIENIVHRHIYIVICHIVNGFCFISS